MIIHENDGGKKRISNRAMEHSGIAPVFKVNFATA
jgi:hypothetical protein